MGFQQRLPKRAAGISLKNWLVLVILLTMSLAHGARICAETGIRYSVSFEGVKDAGLLDLLKKVSKSDTEQDKPTASRDVLRMRVRRDAPLLLQALRSHGFYSAEVTSDITGDGSPVHVVFHITTGPAYLLESVAYDVTFPLGEQGLEERPKAADMGLVLHKPALSKSILDARYRIIRWFQNRAFPLVKVPEPRVIVDHASQSVRVTYRVQTGERARFGKTEIKGLARVDTKYAFSKLPWKVGDPYNEDRLSQGKRNLRDTGLFATVEADHQDHLDREGGLPIEITVKERKPRSVQGGVSYKTDEGPGANASWEHRNVWGRAERIVLGAYVSGIEYGLKGLFEKPEFLRQDQSLLFNLRLGKDSPDAYTSRSLTGSLQVERKLAKGMSVGAGPGFQLSRVEQFGVENDFTLLSFPGYLNWDTSNEALDPSRGGRLRLRLSPFYNFHGQNFGFWKGLAGYSRYIRLSQDPSLILAVRGTVGAMEGAPNDEIPADIRFYAGGSGSVRGYEYKTLGPLINNQPTGGRSLVELSTELRMKLTDTLGFAAFLDGGNAFEAAFPNFEEPLRWGTGLGLRYFTPIGPLRFDVAVPLERREQIDEPFYIYVSIGQAF